MAYRRSLVTRATLFAHQRFASSFSYLHHQDDRRNQHSDDKAKTFSQWRSTHTCLGLGFGASGGIGNVSFRDPRWSQFLHVPMTTSGFLLARNISSSSSGDAADKTMEVVATQAPVLSEVAIAAADSWLPVAALQHAIDGIHTFTGLNWWASIVVMTLVIKTLCLPILIDQHKGNTKLSILMPEVNQIQQEIRGKSPSAVAEGEERIKKLYLEHDVTPLTPLKGLLIQGPIFLSFFLALQNMLEKVPSFKTGGTSWFVDLTTADPFYILPCLTAFSVWITVELNTQLGSDGKPASGIMKNMPRVFAALTLPFTASFPKALFCYWITSNLFSLVFGLTIKQHPVKKLLNIPIRVPPPPSPSAASESKAAAAFSSERLKNMQARDTEATATSLKSPTLEEQNKKSVLIRGIKNLEKQVKGRKNKKRR